MKKAVSGADALAWGAVQAGVSFVTGYAGAPVTAVVDAIVAQTDADDVRVEWAGNEKVAIEMAFGASLGGTRSLLCVKSVGLNVALDPLMAFNLSGCNAGFVILVGDDPGSWGSQNEQDSRTLARMAELPLLEPTTVGDAQRAMQEAFRLSEVMGLPVMVRITRALVLAETDPFQDAGIQMGPPPSFQREFMRWVVLPINVVPLHRQLLQRLAMIQTRFEDSPFNDVQGDGSQGVIAAGFIYQKLMDLLGGTVPASLRLLRLGTFHPLPKDRVLAFLRSVESVLVLEENAPLVERSVRAVAQTGGVNLPILGRDTGHLSRVGELFSPQIAGALNRFVPALTLPTEGRSSRPMPSRESLCEGCPYVPTFDALQRLMARHGGRDKFIVVGDPGCMVRSQMSPYELLDVKHSLGSSVAMATGVALSQAKMGEEKRVIALAGDSGFVHSGLNGLVDAARVGARLLVVLLDNGTTALSGGQPHPGSPVDARGAAQWPVDLAVLARSAGVGAVQCVDLDAGGDIETALERAMQVEEVAVVIPRGACVRWESPMKVDCTSHRQKPESP